MEIHFLSKKLSGARSTVRWQAEVSRVETKFFIFYSEQCPFVNRDRADTEILRLQLLLFLCYYGFEGKV